jgi:hypothetical protein
MAQQTPWAILRCKWSDQTAEPESDAFFNRLFTTTGAGTRNMVEFFDLMSHGSVDVSGSQVFGWFTLPKRQSDYAGNVATAPEGQINRQGLVDLARATATQNSVDLSQFYGVVVCMNTLTDLFGGGMQALCDPGSFRPTVLGQEMGHGYGLAHSRRHGSTDDYQDPWDVMSTWNSCHIVTDSDYTEIGPGMNAANMRGRAWLDESRVWTSPADTFSDVIELRPLHRRDLPGLLAAQVGPYLVEFRVREGWDAAIPRAAVFVHTLRDNQSYVHPGTSGNFDLVSGDRFEAGISAVPWSPYTTVEVTGIDSRNRTATLQVSHRPAEPQPRFDLGGQVFGGVAVDGGGFIVIGGKVVPVPPWDPTIRVLEQLVAYRAVEGVRNSAARDSLRQAALEEIAQHVEAQLEELNHLETPRELTKKQAAPRAKGASTRKSVSAKRGDGAGRGNGAGRGKAAARRGGNAARRQKRS